MHGYRPFQLEGHNVKTNYMALDSNAEDKPQRAHSRIMNTRPLAQNTFNIS